MKKTIALLLSMAVCISLAACSKAPAGTDAGQTGISGTVTASGSSALLPLAQAAADSFMEKNKDCSVVVNGGGSGTGLKQVAEGSVDIGNSDVFAEEKLDATAAAGLTDHKVCTITMAPVVNTSLTVDSLTSQQLIDIFTGKIANWKDVGGPDLDILLVTRPASSGTRALFKTWALNGAEEASNAALETDDSGTLLETVQNNPGAIGYVALSYLVSNDKVKAVSVDGVAPTLENTYNGTYLVWGYEHMYTKGEGSTAAKAFISYMMGEEFAASIESLGYGVSSKMSAEAVAAHENGAPAASDTPAVSGTVTASGSSALLPLAQAAADSFMDKNKDCSVVVNGGGSGTGLKQVAEESVDIGNSDVFAEEKLDATAAAGLTDHKVCTITMAPVVNTSLTVDNLTSQQLIDIFTAKITNWKDVGGPDLDILLVTRPASSGTRALFKTWALNGAEEASNAALETDDSGTLLETVQNNPGAIGYVALSYLVNNDKVKAVSIDGVAPSLENTYNGTYLVWGYEHMYTKGEGSTAAQAFISYMMSDEFASNIESLGYGASSQMSSAAIESHNK
ncbi:MAG: phosphate ABC transporter substrate-binding protein [Clostridiaceae bacterium]|nr:phosphate ABC transporter substrate-binding protein [Clostridiaceae bacterium]